MATFRVAYGTGEGQTAKVADRIVQGLVERGHDATAADVADEPSELSVADADAVIVGASIHVGRHQPAVREFVQANREELSARPGAFFQLSLSSVSDDEARRAEAAQYVDGFLEETGWQPDRIALFGGALRYSKYGFLKRLLMKRIAKEATGDVDASRDYEYTDWAEVAAFTADFAAFVEGRVETPALDSDDGESPR